MKINFKSFYMLCFAASTLTLTSCEDFLDRQEDEMLTFEKIWENRNTTKQYWLNAMSFLPNFNGGYIGDNEPYLGASDECTIAYDRQYRLGMHQRYPITVWINIIKESVNATF